jgi:asparagine synthase (glutamine-hydrolysing)
MIAGIVNWNRQPLVSADLLRMQREIGPFPLGPWDSCQKVGFGLAASAQEGISTLAQDALLTAVLDGVIFNRDEIVSSLGEGVDFSTSDAALFLAGYRCWGQEVLDHVIGDFAIAIWDDSSSTLFAAVDPFGLRPFYFGSADGHLAFGSRMTQLRLLPWVGKELDDRMIVSFLIERFRDPTATFYTNIRQIPGGHFLLADGKNVTVKRYWRPGIRNVCQSKRAPEVLEEFSDRFRQAVRRRLDRRQTTGILMSGGLDSTAIAGMTDDICRRDPSLAPPITVISAIFGDFPCDESSFIDSTLRRLPFASRKFDGRNGAYSLEDLQRDMDRHEWPVLHRQGPLFNGFRESAQSCRAQVLLNGLGGDELTTDYRYFTVPMNETMLIGVFRAACLVRDVEKMPLGKALYLLTREACPELIKMSYRWVRRRFRAETPPAWSLWLASDFCKMAEGLEKSVEFPAYKFGSETLDLAWKIMTYPGSAWANRFLVDEFAAGGFQCRFPFLDPPLFDLVFSVPAQLRPRCRGRPWFKPYISQGLSPYIPPQIKLRDAKVDFESYNCYAFSRCLNFLQPCLFDSSRWESEAYVSRNQALVLFQTVRRETNGPEPRGFEIKKRMESLRNIAGLELWLRDLKAESNLPQLS